MNNTLLKFKTVDYDEKSNSLVILDQTKLPEKKEYIYINKKEDVREAIYRLKVRGAPAIGVAASFGMSAISEHSNKKTLTGFMDEIREAKEYIELSRPTAVNLSWALNRIMKVCEEVCKEQGVTKKADDMYMINLLRKKIKEESYVIREEDINTCHKIGEIGLDMLESVSGILTHCNAGALATCGYGTATAPVYVGMERGKHFKVYADETRPLLQGARLTAYELREAGVDVTLLCDNMAHSLMAERKIQAVLVGCDRVASNGDTANKIGTGALAVVAKYHHIPFYVCAPFSSIDFSIKTGKDIIIEQRTGEEVTDMWYQRPMTARGVKVYNPAFDITDHSLITAFITEKGMILPEKLDKYN